MRWIALIPIVLATPALADGGLKSGRYQVDVDIVLPNIDTRDYGFSTEICWERTGASGKPLGPLGPGPLGACPATAVETEDGLSISTVCKGPNAGWAMAYYRRTPLGFRGEVEMNMGGKNMTVGERQRGHWLGDCE